MNRWGRRCSSVWCPIYNLIRILSGCTGSCRGTWCLIHNLMWILSRRDWTSQIIWWLIHNLIVISWLIHNLLWIMGGCFNICCGSIWCLIHNLMWILSRCGRICFSICWVIFLSHILRGVSCRDIRLVVFSDVVVRLCSSIIDSIMHRRTVCVIVVRICWSLYKTYQHTNTENAEFHCDYTHIHDFVTSVWRYFFLSPVEAFLMWWKMCLWLCTLIPLGYFKCISILEKNESHKSGPRCRMRLFVSHGTRKFEFEDIWVKYPELFGISVDTGWHKQTDIFS